jgi:hypothetical protein
MVTRPLLPNVWIKEQTINYINPTVPFHASAGMFRIPTDLSELFSCSLCRWWMPAGTPAVGMQTCLATDLALYDRGISFNV